MVDTEIAAVEVGDVFEYSWGYDQTNVDYFEVIAVTPSGKSVRLRPIGARSVPHSEGFMSDRCVPVPGNFTSDNVVLKRLRRSTWRSDPADHEWIVDFDYGIGSHIPRTKAAETATMRSWYA